MCGVTQLHCEVCKTSSHYLFYPCEKFLEESFHFQGQALKPTKHFYCAELKWPLNPDETPTKWICETCIEEGRKYYQWSVGAEKGKEAVCNNRPGSDLVAAREDGDVFRHLMPALKAQNDDLKTSVLHKYYKNRKIADRFAVEFTKRMGTEEEKTKVITDYWLTRSSQVAYRSLTLWMPCCRLCNHPTVTAEDGNAVADIEFQPNEIMWKWLVDLKEEILIQTQIKTGFMSTICDHCIEKESDLREQVSQFLEQFSDDCGIAWAVYYWLLTRGSHDVPVFEHATQSLGFPGHNPPSCNGIMDVMAESWKRLTGGMTWADAVDLSPPISCPIPLFVHDKPLICLGQWEDHAKHIQAVTMASTKQKFLNAEPGGDVIDGVESNTHSGRVVYNKTTKAEILKIVQPILEKFKEDKEAVAAFRRDGQMSQKELERGFQVAAKVLERVKDIVTVPAFEMEYVPVRIGILSRQGLLGNKPRRTKKQKEDANVRSLVTIRGACVNEVTGRVMRMAYIDPHVNGSAPNTNGSRPAEMSSDIRSPESGNLPTANQQAGSTSQGNRVHFASGAGVKNSHGADAEDVAMEDADVHGLSQALLPHEAIFGQCDKGAMHLIDYEGTPMGGIIQLPLSFKATEEAIGT